MQNLDNSALVPAGQALPLLPVQPAVQTGALSPNNKQILGSYAGRIYSNHLIPHNLIRQETSGFWNTIRNMMPTSWTVGSNVGWAVSLTHGGQASNYVIGQIAQRLMPVPAPQALTWGESIRRTLLGIEERTVEETARLVLTPRVLPLITAFCSTGGGITVMGAAALAGLLYNRILGDAETKYTLDNLPDLDQLLKVNEDGNIVDANGTVMTLRDLQDICQTINRYDLTCKLSNAKKEEIEGIINGYLKDRVTYLNGEKISESDEKIIQLAKERLMGNNPCNYSQEIENAINLLADNVPSISMRIEEMRQHMRRVKSGVNLYEEPPRSTLLIEEMPHNFIENYEGQGLAVSSSAPVSSSAAVTAAAAAAASGKQE